MSELKPCPFCGGEVVPPDFEDGDCVYWVNHSKECVLNERDFGVRVLFDTELPAWNTRHERTSETIEQAYVNWLGMQTSGVFCECGRLLDDDFIYCPSCGAKAVEQ